MNEKSLIGAIVGDVVGSRYEWHNVKTKDFPLFGAGCRPTDDSVMTLAVGEALLEHRRTGGDLERLAVEKMQEWGDAIQTQDMVARFAVGSCLTILGRITRGAMVLLCV